MTAVDGVVADDRPADGLQVDGLTAVHGRTEVLRGVVLEVADRQLSCVLGPSGCGKTTLLRAVAGFHRPSAGTIRLGGRTLDDARTHLPAERRRVGYIPQDVALFPHLTVAANIGFGLPRARRKAKVAELLELIDLGGHADRHPHQLSGGQQQRVALARALATGPELLLLDEPFSALDASLRDRVRTDVAQLLRRTGTTAVLVTHDATEAMAFADRITVLAYGSVLQTGTPETLYDRPTNAAVAVALGEANLVPVTVQDGVAVCPFGRRPVAAPDGAGTLLVRPHGVVLDDPAGVPATVVASEFRGGLHRVELRVSGLDALVVAHSDRPVEPGSVVQAGLTGAAHLLG